MRRDPRTSAALLALSLTLGSASAGAQAPGASGPLPPGHPPTSGAAVGAPTGAMPPGHPPTGPTTGAPSGAMPPGHPPTGEMPPGHPGGAGMPAGHPGSGAAPTRARGPGDLYEPPEDEILDVEGWAAGTVEVEILDADDRPVGGAPVNLGVLHATVATGEQREKLTATTDARGIARWEGLSFGMAHTYEVSSMRGPSRFQVEPFNLLDKGGRRVRLHVYDTVTDLEEAQIGMRVMAFFALREDAIQAEQVVEVFNLGRTAWQADGVKVALPNGFRAFTRAEEGGVANVDPAEGGYALRGTFRPGRTAVGFRWQMPLTNDTDQTVTVGLPPRVAQARIIAEASKTMNLAVEGAPTPRRTRNRDGRSVLVTERAATQGDRGIPTLSVTMMGLPTKSPARWIAVLAGAGMLAFGVRSLLGRRKEKELPEDAREDLLEAREALLAEIVALERARRRGDVGPKSYERVRAAMLDALANVVSELERSGISSEPEAPSTSDDRGVADMASDGPPSEPPPPKPTHKKRKKRAREAPANPRESPPEESP